MTFSLLIVIIKVLGCCIVIVIVIILFMVCEFMPVSIIPWLLNYFALLSENIFYR